VRPSSRARARSRGRWQCSGIHGHGVVLIAPSEAAERRQIAPPAGNIDAKRKMAPAGWPWANEWGCDACELLADLRFTPGQDAHTARVGERASLVQCGG